MAGGNGGMMTAGPPRGATEKCNGVLNQVREISNQLALVEERLEVASGGPALVRRDEMAGQFRGADVERLGPPQLHSAIDQATVLLEEIFHQIQRIDSRL